MDTNAPQNINDILRASFEGAPAAPPAPPAGDAQVVGDPVPAAPPAGSVAFPDVGIGDAQGRRATAPVQPAVPAAPATAPVAPAPVADDARIARLVEAQKQARQEHLARKQELTLAEQDRRELDEYRALKERAKEDPVAWAEAGGYKPDEYAATLMDKGAMTPDRRRLLDQEKRIAKLDAFVAESRAQQEQARVEQQHSLVTSEMARIAQADPETYDLVARVPGAYNHALQRIVSHYRETGEQLTLEQSLQLTEQTLLDTYFTPVAESPKIRARFAPAQGATSAPSAAQTARQRTPNLRATSTAPAPMDEAASFEHAGKLLFKQFKF